MSFQLPSIDHSVRAELEQAIALSLASSSSSSAAAADNGRDGDIVAIKKRRLNDGTIEASATETQSASLVHKKVAVTNEQVERAIRDSDPQQTILAHPVWALVFGYAKNSLHERLVEAVEKDEKEDKLPWSGALWSSPREHMPPYTTLVELVRKIAAIPEFQRDPALYMATWPKKIDDYYCYPNHEQYQEDGYREWQAAGAKTNVRWGETLGNLFHAFKYIEDFIAADLAAPNSD